MTAQDYSDTAFRCDVAAPLCPDGMACMGGVCGVRGGSPGADAGAPGTGTSGTSDAAGVDDSQTRQFGDAVTFDAYLDSSDRDDNHGASPSLAVSGIPERISLIRFDVSAIPSTATVLSARLTFTVSNPLEAGDLVAHRMLVPWTESEVTYEDSSDDVSWPTPGAANRSFDPSIVTAFAPRETGVVAVELSADTIQGWVADPATNHGLRWMTTAVGGDGAELRSSEAANVAERPVLEVTYR